MKILFSITYYHPYVSGLTIAASRWAEGLEKAGEKVTVLTFQHEQDLALHERIRGVMVKRVPWIAKISKGFISWVWAVAAWRETREHDVTLINLPQFEGVIPALFAKLWGKRVVAVYHCEPMLPKGFINEVVQNLLEVSNFVTLLFADHVVTYTRDYADSSKVLRSLRALRRNLKVDYIVPPIPKPRKNKILTKQLRKKIGESDNVVGVAARLAAEKGIEYLLESIPHINPGGLGALTPGVVKVVIAGPMEPTGEEPYKKRIMKLVKKYKKQVIFLGEVPPEYMGLFYGLLDVLVLPSVNSTEAFGMVQIEAMRYGIPVVASDLPGVRIPIRKTGMGIVVPPRDPRVLAEAIVTVLTHPATYIKDEAEITKLFSEYRSLHALRDLLYS